MERAPYGRSKQRDEFTPTYYGLPAVKPSHYRFLVVSYFFVGGLAGAAQVLAAVADLFGGKQDRTTVRAGRYLALAGAMLSPVFLIADLHTRQRWFNMLRIFRPTSPMSIGSWTLAGFGTFSGAAALFELLAQVAGFGAGRMLARVFGVPAALLGVVMSCYTGVLIAATSTPLWAVAYRTLPPLFGASATATATAALSLVAGVVGAPRGARERLTRLALIAGGAELCFSLLADREWRRHRLAQPLQRPGMALLYRGGAQGAGVVVPLLLHARQISSGRESRLVSALAAVLTLAGGYCLRTAVVLAGNASAENPAYYLGFTQPDAGLRPTIGKEPRRAALAPAGATQGAAR